MAWWSCDGLPKLYFMLMPRKNNRTETLAVKKGRTGLGTSGSMLCPCATVRTIGEIGRGGGGSQKSPFREASVFSSPRRLRSIAHCDPAQLIGRTRLFPKKKITHLCCISRGGLRSVMASTPDSHAGGPGFKSRCRPTNFRPVWSTNPSPYPA